MWPFKCNHPAEYLIVYAKPTYRVIDADFEEVCLHLQCFKCKERIDKRASLFIGGVDAFFARRSK